MGIEDPDADAAEQRRLVTDLDEDDEELGGSTQPPLETDPADFAEQHRAAPNDEDDLYS
ncbi:MAG TPA: hypothetical protein VJS67_15360 [Pseudonocardiaceae bacterium]|jgi:hypothetical protein|nr:hypothetical protein [Pseudonocardiaceae bacterium]